MKLNYLQFNILKRICGKYKSLGLGLNLRDKLEDQVFPGQISNPFREKATFNMGCAKINGGAQIKKKFPKA